MNTSIAFWLSSLALAIGCLAQSPTSRKAPNLTVFMGDSITAFGNAYETRQSQSYGWGWTAQAVFLSNRRITQIYNAGVPGETTAQMLARFPADVIAYNPGTVVILGGTNDASQAPLASSELAAISTNLRSMLHLAKAANIHPVLCTIPPRADGANYKQNAQMINAAIRQLAQLEQILLVDFYPVLTDSATGAFKPGFDSGDGIHPSPAAAQAMAQYFLAVTAKLYSPVPEPILPVGSDVANLLPNPRFLQSLTGWVGNGYGTTSAAAYAILPGDSPLSGNWLSLTFPPATSTGQYYVADGPAARVTPGHRYTYSFKFETSGLAANGGSLNMECECALPAFTYHYLNDTAGTFYIEFTASGGSFIPKFATYPTVKKQPIVLKLAQMTLRDLSEPFK